MRRSSVIWTLLGVAAVTGVFLVNERVQSLEEELRGIRADITSDRTSIKMLHAEWSYLNRPDRIEAMNRQHLGMVPAAPGQYVNIDDLLPARSSRPPAPGLVRVAAPGTGPVPTTGQAPVNPTAAVIRTVAPETVPALQRRPLDLRKKRRTQPPVGAAPDGNAWLVKIMDELRENR